MNILMIVLQFPPMGGMAVDRSYAFAKYWSKIGHKVTIITPKKYPHLGALDFYPTDDYYHIADVIEVDYAKWISRYFDRKKVDSSNKKNASSKLKKLQMFVRKVRHSFLGNSFDINFLWESAVTKRAIDILEHHRYDMLFSSFTPQASFVVASRIKKRFPDIFWVADYRDLWTQNHILKMHPLIKYFQTKKELQTLKDTDMMVTTSDAFAKSLKELHKRDVEVITNGYDEDIFLNLNKAPYYTDKNLIRFIHVGTIYEGVRDPSPFFKALKMLLDEGIDGANRIRVIFYGESGDLNSLIEKYGLENYVFDKGVVSKEDALRAERDCDGLLLIDRVSSDSLSSQGMIPAKVYEYLYVKKPIFAIGVDSNFFTGKIIEDSGLGKAYGDDEMAIYKDLKLFLKGEHKLSPNISLIESFSRKKKAKELLELVEKKI